MRFHLAIFCWNDTVFKDHQLTYMDTEMERLLQILGHYEIQRAILSPAIRKNPHHCNLVTINRNFEKIFFDAADERQTLAEVLAYFKAQGKVGGSRHAFYVNNTAEGIRNAGNVGLTTIGFARTDSAKQLLLKAGADETVRSPMEILKIFLAEKM